MKTFILLSLFSLDALAARIPPRWRFEYDYGKARTNYLEQQPSVAFNDTDIEQISDFHQFTFQYYLLPPWLDFSIGGNIAGISTEDPVDTADQFQYLTVFSNLGVVLPFSDFWSVKLVGEYFYTSMIVKDNAFGFRNLTGMQLYPEIEWLPFGSNMFLQVSPYLKVPLLSDVGNRQETTLGLKIAVPLGSKKELKFPLYSYGRSLIIRIFYTNMRLTFAQQGFISSEIDVRQYGATLGFNF